MSPTSCQEDSSTHQLTGPSCGLCEGPAITSETPGTPVTPAQTTNDDLVTIDLKPSSGCKDDEIALPNSVHLENFLKFTKSNSGAVIAPFTERAVSNDSGSGRGYPDVVNGRPLKKDECNAASDQNLCETDDDQASSSTTWSPITSNLVSKILDAQGSLYIISDQSPEAPPPASLHRGEDVGEVLAAPPPPPPPSSSSSILDSVIPLTVDLSLKDLGTSSCLNDNRYLVWRVFYLVVCLIGVVISLEALDGPAFYASCFSIAYSAICGMVSLRRVLQYRVIKSDDRFWYTVDEPLPYSWLDVMTLQAGPVVSFMIGFMLPMIFNAMLLSQGLVISYYLDATVYATGVIIILTIADVWMLSIPTRLAYIMYAVVVNAVTAYGAAWRFRNVVLMWTVIGASLGAVGVGLIFHALAQTTVKVRREEVEEMREIEDEEKEEEGPLQIA